MSSSTVPEKPLDLDSADPVSSGDSDVDSDVDSISGDVSSGSTSLSPRPLADKDPVLLNADAFSPVSPVSPVSPTEQMTTALLTLNLSNSGAREAVETGLRAWNSIPNVCQPMVDAIAIATAINAHAESVKLHFNPAIGLLSDFVQHCKLIISVNGLQLDASEAILAGVEKTFEDFIRTVHNEAFRLTVDRAAFIGKWGTQISLVLRIGEVFNVPLFTAYVVRDVFNNEALDSDETNESVGVEFMYNAKRIANYSRLDVLLELLLHAASPDPYDTVNVLIAHGINDLIVSQFKEAAAETLEAAAQPNAVIQTECNKFIALTTAANETVTKMIVKSVLIAIIQNPNVKTVDGKQFSDMFPSGQYVKYLGEVAYSAVEGQGPIMLQAAAPKAAAPKAAAPKAAAPKAAAPKAAAPKAAPEGEAPEGEAPEGEAPEGEAPEGEAPEGEAPGSDVNARPILARDVTEHPLTRTDIIVAALTAINTAMGSHANIVAAGGAAVSYYIYDFVRDLNAGAFASFIPVSGLDVEALKQGCDNIPMNDIDCFVFGEVSRQFLLMFSLYMMILYDNFYERPKRYGVIHEQVTALQFNLSKSDNIKMLMYGNQNEDANTKLISKKLKKNPKVQLVTQETKFFSQLVNPLCGSSSSDNKCVVDGYYMQPIDLVKKKTEDFVILYESLYANDQPRPDLEALLESQYSKGADNMVSIKTTMLDLVCIFCNEDKALFIRIFMARKNPKDFARLRAFIEIYLLQLLRFKSTDATFLKYKVALIGEIAQLRIMMRMLNDKYYLEQGNIAAAHDATAATVKGDRDVFLVLLRSIGRKIVLIPDPLDDAIPATFRKETGMNTIRFFKDAQNAQQVKYPFDMSQHMTQLYETYGEFPVDSDPETAMPNAAARTAYDGWLNDVFAQILFPPESEAFFREILRKIMDKTQGINFKDMPVINPIMLELLHMLQKINANGKEMKPLKTPLVNNLLTAIRNTNVGGSDAFYIGNRFEFQNLINKPVVFKTLVEQLLKLQGKPHLDLPEGDAFSEQVNTQIGRILLELNSNPIFKSVNTGWGGSTIKRKRVHKLNARTRSKRGLGARKKSRKKRDAMNRKCKRTRRAAMNA
jgi:hypothetical protein